MDPIILVFVHGYSVTNFNTYGELPERLVNEATQLRQAIEVHELFLGRYISFNDQVSLNDVAKAMHQAIQDQIPSGKRFVCITHSTGGPLVRNWQHLFYETNNLACPMSHLIMLAPANHGSALAQLGKSRLSRLKSWFDGVEPGQQILNWLELGSDEAWQLNVNWIRNGIKQISPTGFFPFVISGQSIDRKLYDHLNAYTGEAGSDGVVRLASANLNNRYLLLEQRVHFQQNGIWSADELIVKENLNATETAFRVIKGKSHSGDTMGIMKSVSKDRTDEKSRELIAAIFDCLEVTSENAYAEIVQKFISETEEVQKQEKLEIEKTLFRKNTFINDRYTMLMFKVTDQEGKAITDFDLLLTAGESDDPDLLPTGFFADRQINRLNPSILSYFFNYDIMKGCEAIYSPEGYLIRAEQPGIEHLGLTIRPRPENGFVRYLPCKIKASTELLEKALQPNSCTHIEIVLKRLLSKEFFRFEKTKKDSRNDLSFKNTDPRNALFM